MAVPEQSTQCVQSNVFIHTSPHSAMNAGRHGSCPEGEEGRRPYLGESDYSVKENIDMSVLN